MGIFINRSKIKICKRKFYKFGWSSKSFPTRWWYSEYNLQGICTRMLQSLILQTRENKVSKKSYKRRKKGLYFMFIGQFGPLDQKRAKMCFLPCPVVDIVLIITTKNSPDCTKNWRWNQRGIFKRGSIHYCI